MLFVHRSGVENEFLKLIIWILVACVLLHVHVACMHVVHMHRCSMHMYMYFANL
jgi:hypothetical protein